VSDISYLFSAGTIGTHRRVRDNTLRTNPHSLEDGFYPQGVNKQAKAGPTAPANITPDLATILDGQAKMQ